MAKQPSYRPLEPSDFFADGRSSRPQVAGTLARGQQLQNSALVTSKQPVGQGMRAVSIVAQRPENALTVLALTALPNHPRVEYVDRFPFALTEADLNRGQARYTIFCAICHDPIGTGRGKIVERGYTQPPSYHTDLSRGFERRGIRIPLRDVPVGYYFEVISQGLGAMPDYAVQVPAGDRWRIIAYIRALQLSYSSKLAGLPDLEREAALRALEGKP